MCDLGKVSIIIPVYNVQEYIVECIESVIGQSYENLEIIMVDDGSNDDSGAICDEYKKRDSRIVVIHQENSGVSAARNIALEIMTGDFVFFLDSDDYLTEDAIEKMMYMQEKTNSDIVIGLSFSEVKERKSENNLYECMDEKELIKRMLLNENVGHAPWAKLFKSDLWKEYRFPKAILGEDYAVLYHVVSDCSRVTLLKEEMYFYRIRSGSLVRSHVSEEQLLLLDISDKVTTYLCGKYEELYIPAMRLNLVTYTKMLKNILDIGFDKYIDVQEKIVSHVKKNSRVVILSKEVRIKDKIKMMALYLGKTFFYVCYCVGDLKNSMR